MKIKHVTAHVLGIPQQQTHRSARHLTYQTGVLNPWILI